MQAGNPFIDHPFRRYGYAWEWLSPRTGAHLEVGIKTGHFIDGLARTTELDCTAVDPNIEYVEALTHAFSFLDPDNAKYSHPTAHRLVWATRFGSENYRRRFLDTSNDLVGDMSVGKERHSNFSPGELATMLGAAGLLVVDLTGANLFWRWFQVPGLLVPAPARGWFDRAILADGRRFNGDPGVGLLRRANLYAAAVRP
jgi:hypothetical protein